MNVTRRTVIRAGIGAAIAAVVAACTGKGTKTASTPTPTASDTPTSSSSSTLSTLTATPSCVDPEGVTVEQTEGPYFKPNSPERKSIREGKTGTGLELTGTVVTTACKPVARALIEFWQADDGGNYDNTGFNLRGHQFTDARGYFQLDTIVPGLYPGRTRHIHVKVQPPGGKILTTQLYFPGEPHNASDSIYRKECEMNISTKNDVKSATFQFVVAT